MTDTDADSDSDGYCSTDSGKMTDRFNDHLKQQLLPWHVFSEFWVLNPAGVPYSTEDEVHSKISTKLS